MKYHSRVLLVLMVNALVVIFVRQINQLLAPHSLYLFIDGLLLVFGAFYLRMGHAVCIAIVTGLCLDAARPISFGTTAAWMTVLTLAAMVWCARLRRENPMHITLVAVVVNLVMFIIFSIQFFPGEIHLLSFINRMLFDGLLSTLVVFFLASRMAKWQYLLLYYLGEDPMVTR